jgi:predicted amidophosphoribosyltransferase
VAAYPRVVAACTNCGVELPSDARFCPRCTAPVELFAQPVEETPQQSWRRLESVAFAALALLLVGLVVLLVLVFGFGFLLEER